jgi:hypothetical protein
MAAGRFIIHRVGTPLVLFSAPGVYVVGGEWWNGSAWGPVADAAPIVRLNGSVLPDGGEWVAVHGHV